MSTPSLTNGHKGAVLAEVSKTFLTIRRFERRFGIPFFKKLAKFYSFRIYGDLRALLMREFSKIFQKNVFLTTRRKKWCFGTPIFQKSSFHCYGDLMALLGACFLKKLLFFTIRGSQSCFGPPFYEKISFSFLRRFAGRFGEVFFQNLNKKRAFAEINPRWLSI